jgi:hypothetical protein
MVPVPWDCGAVKIIAQSPPPIPKPRSLTNQLFPRADKKRKTKVPQNIISDAGYQPSFVSSDLDSPKYAKSSVNARLGSICEHSPVVNTNPAPVSAATDVLAIWNSDFETDFETREQSVVVEVKQPSPPRPLVDFAGAYNCDSSDGNRSCDDDFATPMAECDSPAAESFVTPIAISSSPKVLKTGKRKRSLRKISEVAPAPARKESMRRRGSGRGEKKRKTC